MWDGLGDSSCEAKKPRGLGWGRVTQFSVVRGFRIRPRKVSVPRCQRNSTTLALQVPLFVAVYDSCVLIVSSDNLDGARPPSKHTVYCTLTGSVW